MTRDLAGNPWLEYRVPITAFLLVLSLGSMFVLTSQSGSSFATYILAFYTVAGARRWAGLWYDWVFLLSCALVVLIALSSLWSEPFAVRGAVSEGVRALLVVTFIVAIAEGFRVDWFRDGVTRTLTLMGALAAAVAIVLFFWEPPDDGRLIGLGQLHVHVRAALIFGACLVCGLSWAFESTATRTHRIMVFGAIIVLASAIGLSGSRNAWAAVLYGAFVFLAAHFIRSRAAFVGVAIGAVTLGTVVFALAITNEELREIVLPRGDSFRPAIWAEILDRWLAHGFWLGRGVLTPDDVYVEPWWMPHPHNIYLSVLHQVGLIGFTIFVLLIGWTLVTLVRFYEARDAKLALAILAIALPSYMLDGHEVVDKIGWTWLLLWLPIAIGIGLRARDALDDAQRFGGR